MVIWVEAHVYSPNSRKDQGGKGSRDRGLLTLKEKEISLNKGGRGKVIPNSMARVYTLPRESK